jgi:hypothetical protein
MKVCGYTGKLYNDKFDCSKCIAVEPTKCNYKCHDVTHYTIEEAKEVIKDSTTVVDTAKLMQDYMNLREIYNTTRSQVLVNKKWGV